MPFEAAEFAHSKKSLPGHQQIIRIGPSGYLKIHARKYTNSLFDETHG
jgi:hypothetical protein